MTDMRLSPHSLSNISDFSHGSVRRLLARTVSVCVRNYPNVLGSSGSSLMGWSQGYGLGSYNYYHPGSLMRGIYPLDLTLTGRNDGIEFIQPTDEESKRRDLSGIDAESWGSVRVYPTIHDLSDKEPQCKIREILEGEYPLAHNIVWIRGIVNGDRDHPEIQVYRPQGVVKTSLKDLVDPSGVETYVLKTPTPGNDSVDASWGLYVEHSGEEVPGLNISMYVFTDESDGKHKVIIDGFRTGSVQLSESKNDLLWLKGKCQLASIFKCVEKVSNGKSLEGPEIQILQEFVDDDSPYARQITPIPDKIFITEKDPFSFDVEDVIEWLKEHVDVISSKVTNSLRENCVDGDTMMKMTREEWKEVIEPVGIRMKIQECVRHFRGKRPGDCERGFDM